MQDGAHCHWTNLVLEWLNEKFADRIISRKSFIHWPACSHDLNPLDYYFWGMASYEVYQTNPETLLDVMEAVTAVCTIVGSPEVKKSVRNIRKRLEKCAQQDGGHFQHLVK